MLNPHCVKLTLSWLRRAATMTPGDTRKLEVWGCILWVWCVLPFQGVRSARLLVGGDWGSWELFRRFSLQWLESCQSGIEALRGHPLKVSGRTLGAHECWWMLMVLKCLEESSSQLKLWSSRTEDCSCQRQGLEVWTPIRRWHYPSTISTL